MREESITYEDFSLIERQRYKHKLISQRKGASHNAIYPQHNRSTS